MRFDARPVRTRNVLSGLRGIMDDALSTVIDSAKSVYDSAQGASQAAIDDMRSKIAQFQQAYTDFNASRADAYAVGMGEDWNSMSRVMERVKGMVSSVGAIGRVTDAAGATVSDWLWNIFHAGESRVDSPTPLGPDFSNVESGSSSTTFYDRTGSLYGLRGLGVAPIIAAAAVAGVTAAIIYALSKYADYQSALLAKKSELIAQGKLPASALDSPSVIGESKDLLKWVAIIAAGYFVAYPLLKKHKVL